MKILNWEATTKPEEIDDFKDINQILAGGKTHYFCFTTNNNKSALRFTLEKSYWCCGLTEIGNLGIKNVSSDDFNSLIKEILKVIKGDVLICTSTEDREEWQDRLTHCPSVKLVNEFYNENSKHNVKVWMKA